MVNLIQIKSKKGSKVIKVKQHTKLSKEGYANRLGIGRQKQSKKNSDGIQVMVNSVEEEELDYDDVLLTEGDEVDCFCGETPPLVELDGGGNNKTTTQTNK